ncbi:DUF1266 domain-containing protein [Actinophytocola algeriensis]|uniref:DUF1266 domain-containing protein n=1 Tax=Actinophytocola algeriensis TaxID=1768010 RepID=UPI00161FE29F|nr:DUF1266 domain-containing protein [Actinophytocola algeriensis]
MHCSAATPRSRRPGSRWSRRRCGSGHETIPSLLACHWAEGVHVVRTSLVADWLARPQAAEYLTRAGELTARWYPSWSTVLSAQLLPALLNDDALAAARRATAAPRRGQSAAGAAERRFRSGGREVNLRNGGGIPRQFIRYGVA